MIPGLENAEFLRFGQIHRNTYLNAPRLLAADLSLHVASKVFIAGQLCGVEGYVECMATGLLAGIALAGRVQGEAYEGAATDHGAGFFDPLPYSRAPGQFSAGQHFVRLAAADRRTFHERSRVTAGHGASGSVSGRSRTWRAGSRSVLQAPPG